MTPYFVFIAFFFSSLKTGAFYWEALIKGVTNIVESPFSKEPTLMKGIEQLAIATAIHLFPILIIIGYTGWHIINFITGPKDHLKSIITPGYLDYWNNTQQTNAPIPANA